MRGNELRGGDNLGTIVAALLRLLDAHGAAELEAAIGEALERGVPHRNAVRRSLTRRREQRNQPTSIPVELPSEAKARDIVVRDHHLVPLVSTTTRSRGRCAGNGLRPGRRRVNPSTWVVPAAARSAASSSSVALASSSSS